MNKLLFSFSLLLLISVSSKNNLGVSQVTVDGMNELNKRDGANASELEHKISLEIHRFSKDIIAIRQLLQQQLHSGLKCNLQQEQQRKLHQLKDDLQLRLKQERRHLISGESEKIHWFICQCGKNAAH